MFTKIHNWLNAKNQHIPNIEKQEVYRNEALKELLDSTEKLYEAQSRKIMEDLDFGEDIEISVFNNFKRTRQLHLGNEQNKTELKETLDTSLSHYDIYKVQKKEINNIKERSQPKTTIENSCYGSVPEITDKNHLSIRAQGVGFNNKKHGIIDALNTGVVEPNSQSNVLPNNLEEIVRNHSKDGTPQNSAISYTTDPAYADWYLKRQVYNSTNRNTNVAATPPIIVASRSEHMARQSDYHNVAIGPQPVDALRPALVEKNGTVGRSRFIFLNKDLPNNLKKSAIESVLYSDEEIKFEP